MPMINYSTLFYCVNNIQREVEKQSAEMDYEPSERSVQNILDFALCYETVETEETGYIEMILN
ncbi:hypothetical protein [uncultured Draconibacterium sp.]|uniref:hypothetical protein n=1 Tax=uncultured Draconibacterium sp. TaxID=1573823 RepID=UPI0029C92F0B|nr:hypothetical protein [uncultured Draconibacterium sp.]